MVSATLRLPTSPIAKAIFIIGMLVITSLVIKRWIDRYGTPPPLTELFPRDAIYVGVDASYPPFAIATANDLYGIDIDIAKELGEHVGMDVKFVNMGFDGLYDSLISGQVDIVVSALLIDDFRTADVNYSWAYFNAGLILITSADSPIRQMEDLSNKRIAFEYGSEADSEVRRWSRRIPPFTGMPYERPTYALDAVRLGEADAALVDAISGRLYLREHPEWNVRYEYITTSLFSVASRIDRKWVFKLVNAAMLDMLNDGTVDRILSRWL